MQCACCIIILISFPNFWIVVYIITVWKRVATIFINILLKYFTEEITWVCKSLKCYFVSHPLSVFLCAGTPSLWWQTEPNDSSSASPQSARSDTCTESPGKDRGSTLFRGIVQGGTHRKNRGGERGRTRLKRRARKKSGGVSQNYRSSTINALPRYLRTTSGMPPVTMATWLEVSPQEVQAESPRL